MPKARKKQAPSPSPPSTSTASSSCSGLEDTSPRSEEDHYPEEDNVSSEQELTSPINLAKAATKLHHVARSLRATAKKAKTFEIQKLVKKSKDVRKDDSKVAELALISEELTCLKELETDFWAGRVLVTKMVKARLLPKQSTTSSLSSDSGFPYLPIVRVEPLLGPTILSDSTSSAHSSKALDKAKAKLISSKLLADQVGKFVEELKKLVGIETFSTNNDVDAVELGADTKGKSKATAQEAEISREWSGSEVDSDVDPLPHSDDDNDMSQNIDEQELALIGKQKLAALGDLSQWDDMVGTDSEAEDHNTDNSRSKTSQEGSTNSTESSEDDGLDSDSDSDSDSEIGDSNDEDDESDSSNVSSHADLKRKRNKDQEVAKKKSRKSSAGNAGTSTFLPSLSHGFIVGDRSDDDWSDAEADLADRDMSELKKGAKKERRNRMGQRARKAIWEKKFGKNANHLKILEKEKRPRKEKDTGSRGTVSKNGRVRPPAFEAPKLTDAGWGKAVAPVAKPAKISTTKASFRDSKTPAASQPRPAEQSRSTQPSVTAKQSKDHEMHPSWIAKQKQKEFMAQVKPEGKKIVFD